MASVGEILIIIALLIVAVQGGKPQCPDLCKCPMPYRADCFSLSLTRVPANLHREVKFLNASNNQLSTIAKSILGKNVQHLRILDLSNNKISLIQNGAMSDMKELIFLYLTGNELTTLDQNVFEYNPRLEFLKLDGNILLFRPDKPFLDIPSLKSLDISSCNIKIIPELAFVKLINLEELHLSQNRLLLLESGVFLPLKQLKSLYLSGNLLKELQADIFMSLKELKILDLSRNQFQRLNPQVFAPLENINILDLSYNKLKVIEGGIFTPMKNLERLHLQKNLINSVSENQFSELNNLAVLDLSGNNLEKFHFRIICRLDNLTYLKLSGNRLSCDCTLWQLWNWTNAKNVRMLSTCEEPEFEFSVRGFEELRKNNSCNATTCEIKIDTEIPQEIFSPVYLYVGSGFGLLLFLVGLCLTVWAVLRYRRDICRKRNSQISAAQHSISTMTYFSRQQAEQFAQLHRNSLQRQLDIQHELHRRHQETLMRSRLQREHSSSLNTLPGRNETNNENRHSYHEQRFPSVLDEERSWFNADTLPSNNRTTVYFSNLTPIRRDSSARRDTPTPDPVIKAQRNRGSKILEEDTSTPNCGSSMLCPVSKGARGSLILDFSSESDAVVPEESTERNRL